MSQAVESYCKVQKCAAEILLDDGGCRSYVAAMSNTKNAVAGGAGGDELLDGDEVCRRLCVSSRTLYNMRERGELPFVRVGEGRLIRYTVRDLDAYIAKRRETAA